MDCTTHLLWDKMHVDRNPGVTVHSEQKERKKDKDKSRFENGE